jgi:hypothetical protein
MEGCKGGMMVVGKPKEQTISFSVREAFFFLNAAHPRKCKTIAADHTTLPFPYFPRLIRLLINILQPQPRAQLPIKIWIPLVFIDHEQVVGGLTSKSVRRGTNMSIFLAGHLPS